MAGSIPLLDSGLLSDVVPASLPRSLFWGLLAGLLIFAGGALLLAQAQTLEGALVCVAALALLAWALHRRRVAARAVLQRQSRLLARLERALDASLEGVWEYDVRQRATFCTDQCLRLAGARPSSSPLRALLARLDREQRRRVLKALREAWAESGRLDELLRIGRPDGGERWLRLRARVSAGRDFITGALADVSDEVELTRERNRFHGFIEGVVDALPVAVSVKNEQGRVILANRAFCEGIGRRPIEILGKQVRQFLSSEYSERLEALDRLTLETGLPHHAEDWVTLPRIGGRRFLRVVKNRCVDRHGAKVLVTTLEDLTQLRQYAQRMAELSMDAEAYVQRLIRAIPHPLFVKNAEGRYLIVNQAFAAQRGLSIEEMEGRTARELFGDAAQAYEASDARALAGEAVCEEDVLRDTQSGEQRYWLLSKARSSGVEGQALIVGSGIEITALRQSEEELRSALASQTRWRNFMQQIFDALPYPLFVKDARHRYLMTNRAHADFLQCEPDQIVGSTAWDHVDPVLAAQIEREETELFARREGEVSVESEHLLYDRDGEPRPTRIRKLACEWVEGGRVIIGASFDMAAMHGVEQELRNTLLRISHSRAFLQDVFDALPSPIAVKNERHVYVMVNRALSALHGMTPEQMVGKTTWDINLAGVARETVEADDQLFAIGPGVVREREVPIRYADGKIHRVRLRKVVCLDPSGERLVITASSDVTELTEKEHSLTEALERQTRMREFLQSVFDALPFAACVKDERMRWVMANTAAGELFGVSKQAFPRRPIGEVLPPEMAEQVCAMDEKLLSGECEGVLAQEVTLPDAAGNPRYMMLHQKLVHDHEGKRVIIGVAVDLSELRAAERARRRALERLDALFRNAPLGIVLLDAQGRFLRANPAFMSLSGLEGSQLDTLDFISCVAPDSRALWQARQAAAGEGSEAFELQLRSAAGQDLPVLASAVLAEPDAGEDSRLWLLLQDLSERKASEDALRRHRDTLRELVLEQTADLIRAKEAAERTSAAQAEFIAQLSHELRNPLHAILSFARLGEGRGDALEAARAHDYFARIAQSGERLLGLFDALLDLARLEAGRMKLVCSWSEIDPLLDAVVREFEGLLLGHQLNLTRIEAGALPPLWMDAERIAQVMRNLLSNAVKFAPTGSRITLQTRLVDGDAGRRSDDAGQGVEIVVSDEGPGIPAGELEQIFDRFTQGSLNRPDAGGSGLGLAISREIVQAHRGRIRAHNGERGGAEFVVRLPVQGPSGAETPVAVQARSGA